MISRACATVRRLPSGVSRLLAATTCTSFATSADSCFPPISCDSPARPGQPPIRIAATDCGAGRGVFSTRRIVAGDAIHSARAVVVHPSPSLTSKVCYNCLRRVKGAPDPVPHYFCSQICLQKSKDFYEVEKKLDSSLFDEHCRFHSLRYPFMVKRLACMVIAGAVTADCLDILQPANLYPQTVLQMEEEFKLLRNAFENARFPDEMMGFLCRKWYIDVLARVRINAFRVELVEESYKDLFSAAAASIADDASVGHAVYDVASLYNHDCDPNVHIMWANSSDAKLTALRDIEEGEELRICYIDASMGHDVRQRILLEGFGFRCHCLRCTSGD